MYQLSIRCLTAIVLAGVVVTTLALSSSAQRVSPVTASLNVAAMPPSARFEVHDEPGTRSVCTDLRAFAAPTPVAQPRHPADGSRPSRTLSHA